MTRAVTQAELAALALALPRGEGRQLVAVAGPPASGKSTLAEWLAAEIAAAGRAACVVPMDGFHLDNALLDARGLRARKGAPETFDRPGLAVLVQRLRAPGPVVYPLFDRARDLAVAQAAEVPEACELVVLEGNYLLLHEPGWRDLALLWHLSVWVEVPEAVLRSRLVARWLEHGHDYAAAVARSEENDLPNARRLIQNRLPSDVAVELSGAA